MYCLRISVEVVSCKYSNLRLLGSSSTFRVQVGNCVVYIILHSVALVTICCTAKIKYLLSVYIHLITE